MVCARYRPPSVAHAADQTALKRMLRGPALGKARKMTAYRKRKIRNAPIAVIQEASAAPP